MKLVLHLSDFGWPVEPATLRPLIKEIATMGEECGFDGIGVADHLWLHPMVGGPGGNSLEAYSTLAFIAAHTERVRLLTVATGAHFRHPAVLAKTVTTLDVLSGGRAWLGIGAGHFREECEGLGIQFPDTATRFELLEDALRVCLAMWDGEKGIDAPLQGRHVSAERLLNLPQSLQRPHPPVLIAGTGPAKTLAMVARYGDACSLRPGPEIPEQLETLRRHCDVEGTDFDRIEKTCAFQFDADEGGPKTDELLKNLEWLGGMGIETVAGRVTGIERLTPIEQLGRYVIPAAAAIEPATSPARS